MMTRYLASSLTIAALFVLPGCSERPTEAPITAAPAIAAPVTALPRIASPAGATVFFISPADGSTVSSPLQVEFGLEGMQVVAAGVNDANSGHHHLLVDTGLPDLGLPIPKDEKHIHFGDGSSVATLNLAPGEHALQLLLGDHLHIPHEPPVMSTVISIIVE
ncbi:MAG: DUF4399 domain-containing protein [Proteobacteria bacterium]|nr:DUF4399 domain-containing protein [Pseudomonadota bacterium]MDA1064055.1 DUF4399 domain-containing protein [Pseudomonadota bacterium]